MEENQISILSTFNDDNLSDVKYQLHQRKLRKYVQPNLTISGLQMKGIGENISQMKLKSSGMLECTDEKVEINKSINDRFSSFWNLNFSGIFPGLLEEEHPISRKISISPPERIADTSVCSNSSEPSWPEAEEGILDSQDQELLDIWEVLETADPNIPSERLATSGTTRI